MQKRIIYFLTVFVLFFGANFFIGHIASQTEPFSMRQMLNAVASVKEGRVPQSRIISDIRKRKVDFQLTKENEKLLRDEGATNEIIEAVRQNSPPLPTPTIKRTPSPTPSPSPVSSDGDASFYNKRGIDFFNKREYDKAIADYNRAIELNPRYYQAYYNRGIAYRNQGEYDKAIADYTKAIDLSPNYSDAYNNRGVAYYYKSEYDNAIADYNKVIQLNPNDADAYNNRGVAYENKGDYDRAIADYRKALQLNPEYEKAKNNLDRVLKKKQEN